MGYDITVTTERAGYVASTLRIQPMAASSLHAASRFQLTDPGQGFVVTVDAEAFYRAVCAAWQAVKPLTVP